MRAWQLLQYLGGLALICGLVSCNGRLPNLGSRPATPKPTPKQTLTPLPLPTPKPQTLKVTVDEISDLQVKAGAVIVKGQVIAAPITAQKRLALQRQALLQQLAQLRSLAAEADLSAASVPSQDGLILAQKRLKAAEAALANFRQNSPFTDYALENLPLPEEQVKLERLQAELRAAQANLKQQQNPKKALPTAQNQSQDTLKITEANLNKELQSLDAQIKALKVVYSPYAGLVKQIKPLGTKGALQFELTILAQAPAETLQNPPVALPSGSPGLPPLPSPQSPQDSGLFLPPSLPSPPPSPSN